MGGDSNDNIYCCDMQSNDENLKWKLNNQIKMPHCIDDELDYDILVFGDVIIAFYFQNKYKDIWCLDLLDNKWFKSKQDH